MIKPWLFVAEGCCSTRGCGCGGVGGGGEDTEVEPTDPGSLKPWALSSGWSKKLRLNSDPASNDTSALSFSGGGALPRFALRDWSILKTSMSSPSSRRDTCWCTRAAVRPGTGGGRSTNPRSGGPSGPPSTSLHSYSRFLHNIPLFSRSQHPLAECSRCFHFKANLRRSGPLWRQS